MFPQPAPAAPIDPATRQDAPAKPMGADERRRYPRYKVAGLACSVSMLGIESHAMVCDMSAEGANIILPSSRPPSTYAIVICMRLPGSGIAVAEALIRSFTRVPTGYSLHVALDFPDQSHRERVQRFLHTIR